MALCTISGMVNKTAATGAGSDVKKRYRAAGFGCRTLAGNRNEQGPAGPPAAPTPQIVSVFNRYASWSDTIATRALAKNRGTSQRLTGDLVTQFNAPRHFAETRLWNGTIWAPTTANLDGNRLVAGTVAAQALALDGVTLRGNADGALEVGRISASQIEANAILTNKLRSNVIVSPTIIMPTKTHRGHFTWGIDRPVEAIEGRLDRHYNALRLGPLKAPDDGFSAEVGRGQPRPAPGQLDPRIILLAQDRFGRGEAGHFNRFWADRPQLELRLASRFAVGGTGYLTNIDRLRVTVLVQIGRRAPVRLFQLTDRVFPVPRREVTTLRTQAVVGGSPRLVRRVTHDLTNVARRVSERWENVSYDWTLQFAPNLTHFTAVTAEPISLLLQISGYLYQHTRRISSASQIHSYFASRCTVRASTLR